MSRLSSRSAVAALTLALTTGGAVSPWHGALVAQDDVPTVAVLKRIAEAVEGYNGSGRVWVVLDSTRQVHGIYPSRDSANLVLRTVRSGLVHGPILARELALNTVPSRCVHIQSVMTSYCPEIPVGAIESLRLTFVLRGGESRTITLPGNADAIFLSMSALDKFAFPYYARVYGVAEANAMRDQALREGRPRR